MSSTDDNDRGARSARTSRPPSSERERQRRRIWRATRALAVGGVAATAAFLFAVAHGGGRSATPTADATQSRAGDTGAVVPLSSAEDDANSSGDENGSDSVDDEGGGTASPSIAASQAAPTPTNAAPLTHSGGS